MTSDICHVFTALLHLVDRTVYLGAVIAVVDCLKLPAAAYENIVRTGDIHSNLTEIVSAV